MWIPPKAKASVGDDLSANFFAKSTGAAVMIRMAVCDENGVHSLQWHADFAKARLENAERFPTRHAGIDDRHATIILENVHVDVAEAREIDRQLGAQYARSQFNDFVGRALSFLTHRTRSFCRRRHDENLLEGVGPVVGELTNTLADVVESPMVARFGWFRSIDTWIPPLDELFDARDVDRSIVQVVLDVG